MSLELLQKACAEFSQREVGKKIGKSASTVNQLLKGTYPNPEKILRKVGEVFEYLRDDRCECPVLGVIHRDRCKKYRELSYAGKLKRDRMYMQVRDYCSTCNYKNTQE